MPPGKLGVAQCLPRNAKQFVVCPLSATQQTSVDNASVNGNGHQQADNHKGANDPAGNLDDTPFAHNGLAAIQ